MCARINTAFVNPYNFIPFDSSTEIKRAGEASGDLSGVITYSIRTVTPLIIPNTSNPNAFKLKISRENKEDKEEQDTVEEREADLSSREYLKSIHKSYDFFSYDDLSEKDCDLRTSFRRPVIPGSEIRGMIRSQYEILTDSCLSSVDTDDILSKRTQEKYKAGLLKKTSSGYELYEAQDCLLRTKGRKEMEPDLKTRWDSDVSSWERECYVQDDVKEGDCVWVKLHMRGRGIKPLVEKIIISEDRKNRPKGFEDGYVMKGVSGPDLKGSKQNKHCCHVFVQGRKSTLPGDRMIDELLRILEAYDANGKSDYSEYKKSLIAFMTGETGKLFPVYYSPVIEKTDGIDRVLSVALSPAVITRETYKHTVKDMVGTHNPCCDPYHLCPACRLFGILGKHNGKTFQKMSRIRFCDAILDEATTTEEAFRFDGGLPAGLPEESFDPDWSIFTLQPLSSPKLNNLEFYLKRPEGAFFWTYDYMIDSDGKLAGITPSLNGRKFYWHNMVWYKNALSSKRSNQNISVRPVVPGRVFHGKVYFENLTGEELNMLCYVLNAGEGTRESLIGQKDTSDITQKSHGYKLGAAKPLGFGSISVNVEDVSIHQLHLDEAKKQIVMHNIPYAEFDPDGYKEPDIEKTILSNFMKMTSFRFVEGTAPGIDIKYPTTGDPDKPEIYNWFTSNHGGYKRESDGTIREVGMPESRNAMVYKRYLVPMQPILQSTGFDTFTGRGRIRSIWMAKYALRNRKMLPVIEGKRISDDSYSDWASMDSLKRYADNYQAVLLPSSTRDDLIDCAKHLYEHVIVATKGKDGKDDGWIIMK